MKRAFVYAIVVGCSLVLQACSYIEQFVIYNQSDKAIYVTYELEDKKEGVFPVFTEFPTAKMLNSSDDIYWEKEANSIDENTNLNCVSVAVQPHSALIIGTLHNDSYKSYDQKFKNGRWFNLKILEIAYINKIIRIIPSTYDTYFKKKQGKIRFTVE